MILYDDTVLYAPAVTQRASGWAKIFFCFVDSTACNVPRYFQCLQKSVNTHLHVHTITKAKTPVMSLVKNPVSNSKTSENTCNKHNECIVLSVICHMQWQAAILNADIFVLKKISLVDDMEDRK